MTDVVQNVAERWVGRDDFDAVLHGAPATGQRSPSERVERAILAIKQRLDAARIAANPPLKLTVRKDGTLQVSSEHPQAAHIEAVLASDPMLRSILRDLNVGGQELTIADGRMPSRLTSLDVGGSRRDDN